MPTWIKVPKQAMEFGNRVPTHRCKLLPGMEALKAITTRTVLARTQEMLRANMMPKAVWRSMQEAGEG